MEIFISTYFLHYFLYFNKHPSLFLQHWISHFKVLMMVY